MEMLISEQDIQDIKDFLNEGKLAQLMNREGLSWSAMAFTLQAILDKVDEVEKS